MFLRQSTSQLIRFGPFVDIGDGVTEEIALTITQALMRLSKDGAAFAQKNAAGNATHDSDGWYSTTLNATDTATVGELLMNVQIPATALPVWMRWWVIEEAVYDAHYGAAAAGPLQATTPGRTLDILATGEVAANVLLWRGTLPNILIANRVDTNAQVVGDKTGYALSAAGIDAIWDEAVAGHVAGGSVGNLVERLDIIATGGAGGLTNARAVNLDNLDALITSRLAPTVAARTLDIAATGEAGLDFGNTVGTHPTVALTAAGIDAIWDELMAGHVTADSAAVHIKDILADVAGIAGAAMRGTDGVDTAAMRGTDGVDTGTHAALVNLIWNELTAEARTAASYGQLFKDNLNATISSRAIAGDAMALTAAAVDAIWDELQSGHSTGGSFGLFLDQAITGNATPAEVLTQVNAALDTTIAELSQGIPATTPTIRTGLMLMYMALRNKLDVATSATDTLEIHNDAGTRIAQKLLTDAAGDYSEAKMISGV